MSETRAAIWAALSTQEQNRGDDKTSMRDQLERCRKAIGEKGWTLATTVLAGIVWHAERGTVTLRWDDK